MVGGCEAHRGNNASLTDSQYSLLTEYTLRIRVIIMIWQDPT